MFSPFRRPLSPLLAIGLAFSLAACDGVDENTSYPKGHKLERKESRGSLLGDDGGFNLLGGGRDEQSSASPIGVNGFLWRATLDTLSFLPFTSADPFGGTILTDWYEDPKAPGERYKVTAVILDKTLRADGVRVSVFKQRLEKVGAGPAVWRDQPVDERLGRKLEDTILTRARELRIAQLGR